jgi:microsomal dipeptidase-like Zn-dependent dipeptidase
MTVSKLASRATPTFLFIALALTQSAFGQDPSMRGFADIHVHQFANLAFGGKFVAGHAYEPIDQALSLYADTVESEHSQNHGLDLMGAYVAGYPALYYGNDGYPTFNGWPAFFEVSHQHVYQDWLFRAVQGGLRLMVMMAVDSPLLCNSGIHTDGRNCNDEMSTINNQIAEAKNMQAYIDRQAGGDGLGWYRIVTTPAQARQVIQQGKLAVVLGVETAHLFNCKSEPCNWLGPFQQLWNSGVRHFFPIHQDENAFGGPSYFLPSIQVQANWVGDWFDPVHWFSPYVLHTHPCPQYKIGRCDDLGLTDTGKAFVEVLMNHGALIDVDHMSDRAFSDTLDIATTHQYPVVASHSSFNAIKSGNQDHEGQLTGDELNRIRGVGGMLGLISSLESNGPNTVNEVLTYVRPGKTTIPHGCGRSTATFAQGLFYAIDHAPEMSFAIGTDSNGGLQEAGPRFGSRACDGGINPVLPRSTKQLPYPFTARGVGSLMPRLVSGQRTFDFNFDGLANEGMLPDMFADLETIGVSAAETEPLFHSAEGYVEMWERAEAAAANMTNLYGPPASGDEMQGGTVLYPNGAIASPNNGAIRSANGLYTLVFQADSNLVLYAGNVALWASGTQLSGATQCIFQADGNFVIYVGSKAIWASNTSGNPNSYLRVQDDGNVVIYRSDNQPLWATNTRTTTAGVQMLLDASGQVWAKDYFGRTGWVLETPPGEKVIASGGQGLEMLLDGQGQVWAKNSIGSGGWSQETPAGEKAISAGSNGLQMLLDSVGQVWAKNSIGNGGWTLESPAGEKAIAAGSNGLQMLLDSVGQVWAKSSIGNGGWTLETPAGEKAITAGSNGLQMLLDSVGQVWAKSSIGNGGWTLETPAGEKAIAAGGNGLQMLLDSAGQVWAKNFIGNGGWTAETTTGGQKAIAAGENGLQMMLDAAGQVWARNSIGNGPWIPENSTGYVSVSAGQ